jgi:hypothetical protein
MYVFTWSQFLSATKNRKKSHKESKQDTCEMQVVVDISIEDVAAASSCDGYLLEMKVHQP